MIKWVFEKCDKINDNKYGMSLLLTASEKGFLNIVQMFVEKGVDVNKVYPGNGYYLGTALQSASQYGHFDLVKFLIKSGADVNVEAEDKTHSALDVAVENGHYDIAKYLIEHSAAVKGSQLVMASKNNNIDIVKLLIKKKVDINYGYPYSALKAAAGEYNLEIVDALNAAGAKE